MNSYVSSMTSMAPARSVGATSAGDIKAPFEGDQASYSAWTRSRQRGPDGPGDLSLVRGVPALGIEMILIFLARHPAPEHRARQVPLVGTQREIDMDHHQGDQRHGGEVMGGIDDAPAVIAE